MTVPIERTVDVEILNLCGGLLTQAHVTAPVVPAPEQLTPAAPLRLEARAQARRARQASRIVGTAAAALLAGGFAAARQMPPATPIPVEAAATTTPTQAPAHPRGASVMGTAEAAPADTVTPETTQPGVKAAERHAGPPAPPRLVLPTVAPMTSPIAALGAPPAELDRGAAAIAIAVASKRAAACIEPGDARRSMSARVLFSASGRVTSATITGGPFTGTETGACIARALRGARVGAFEGEPVAVTTTLHL